jgi:hypothetical protein
MANYSSTQKDKAAVSPYISVAQFISDLKEVERQYFHKDDRDLINTCTRIRAHYYGLARKKSNFETIGAALIFNNAIPRAKSIYYDVTHYTHLRIRKLYENDFSKKKDVYERLTSRVQTEQGPNPSPYLVHNGNEIDLGQILYGFESLVYQMDIGYFTGPYTYHYDYTEYNTYHEPRPNPSQYPKTYSNSYNSIPLRRINDLTGWVANIATPTAEVLQHEINGESRHHIVKKSKLPPEAARDKYYEISAPDSDLFANADAIGIYYAYKKLRSYYLNNNSEIPRLSDVFELYYTGKTRLKYNEHAEFIPGAPIPMPHTVSMRWLIFSVHFGFAKYIGINKFQWIPANEENLNEFLNKTTKESNDINHKSLNDRLILFAEFWASTYLLFYGKDERRLDKIEQIEVEERRKAIAKYMAVGSDPFLTIFNVHIREKVFRFNTGDNYWLDNDDILNIKNNMNYFLKSKFLPWLKIQLDTTPNTIIK